MSVLKWMSTTFPEGRWIVIPPWYHGVLLRDDDYKQAWQNYMATGVVP